MRESGMSQGQKEGKGRDRIPNGAHKAPDLTTTSGDGSRPLLS